MATSQMSALQALASTMPSSGTIVQVQRIHGEPVTGSFELLADSIHPVYVVLVDDHGARWQIPWSNVSAILQTRSQRQR